MKPGQAVVLSLLLPTALSAQSRVVRLGTFDSTPDTFSRIVSMRELADGRIIIADRREKLIAAVSFTGEYSRRIGSLGSGPGQYLGVGPLVPMDDDSTALIDGAAGQWMLMKGSEPAGMMSPASMVVRSTHFAFAITPSHAYGIALPARGLGATAHDTMALIRVSRRDARVDTVTLLAAPTANRRVDSTSRANVTTIHISIPARTMSEQAAVFDDGWIAVARLHPYRVDWIDPAGKAHPGRPLSEPAGDSTPPFTALFDDPSDLTPALKRGVAGELLIRRLPAPAEPEQRYDVVDRESKLVAQIIMPARELIIGVGQAHIYTVRTGEDGKQRLRRYGWPLK